MIRLLIMCGIRSDLLKRVRTHLALPSHPGIVKEFGAHGFGPTADSKRSLALASFLYDPLNLITLDAQIALILLMSGSCVMLI